MTRHTPIAFFNKCRPRIARITTGPAKCRYLPALLIAISPSVSLATKVYKCEIDGTIEFRYSACPGQLDNAVEVHPSYEPDPRGPTSAQIEDQMRIEDGIYKREWQQHVNQAIDERRLIKGMNKSQVVKSWGKPARKYHNGGRDQWVYEWWPNETRYIYFDRGKLTNSYSR